MEGAYKLKEALHQYTEPRVYTKVLTKYEWMVLGWKEDALDLNNPIDIK